MILPYDQRWWWDCYDLVFHENKLAMMTMILKYVGDWFGQRWVDLRIFNLKFIWNWAPWWEIILQGKKGSLIENYLTEEEGFLNKKLSCRAREVYVLLFKIK
jgi:hypothetical protein